MRKVALVASIVNNGSRLNAIGDEVRMPSRFGKLRVALVKHVMILRRTNMRCDETPGALILPNLFDLLEVTNTRVGYPSE